MNKKEIETGRKYKEWDNKKLLNTIREKLNSIRKKPDGKIKYVKFKHDEPKYKVGDLVYYYLDVPQNIRGEELRGNRREGDRTYSTEPKAIKQVLRYPGNILHRYVLNYKPNVSYTENQLKPAKDKEEELYEIKKIIKKDKNNKNNIIYLVWFKNDLKKNAVWIEKKELLRTGAEDSIKEFEKQIKKR